MYCHNPWLTTYKEPFGAVANNQSMRLVFECDQATDIKLVIHRDFGAYYEFEMTKVDEASDNKLFETSVTFDHGRALYFYHFEISEMYDWGIRRLFYCASDTGGAGQIVDNEAKIKDFQVTVYEGEDTVPDWYKKAVFYQIFPDRFYNGNADGHINAPKKNSFIYGAQTDDPFYVKNEVGDIVRWDFYGGNLRGIIDKLSYLQSLGVTALYLNPIFAARSNHRYDTSDYLQIDSMLGTLDDFKELVEKLHAAGMRLILDGVFSHVGKDSRYFNLLGTFGEGVGAAQNPDSPYFDWFKFTDYPLDYKAWWGIKDLPEVDKSKESFRNFIYAGENSVIHTWTRLGVDGWRLDVADELPDDFIRGIRETLDGYEDKVLIGEVWEDASNKISYDHRRDYILGDSLNGVMNYPFRDLTIAYLDGHINAEKMALSLMRIKENYPAAILAGNLNNMGTHDTERVLSMVGDDNLALAVGLLFSLPGVPCVYYGDEAGLTGRKDPSNRKFFPWEEIHSPIFTTYMAWITKYKASSALIEGEFFTGWVEDCLAIVRVSTDETIFYVINPEVNTVEVNLAEMTFTQTGSFSEAVHQLGKITLAAHGAYYTRL